MKNHFILSEQEKTRIRLLHDSRIHSPSTSLLKEQPLAWITKLFSKQAVKKIESTIIKNMDQIYKAAQRNILKQTVKGVEKNVIKSLSGHHIPADAIEKLTKLAAQGKNPAQFYKYLPRQLADGTNFRAPLSAELDKLYKEALENIKQTTKATSSTITKTLKPKGSVYGDIGNGHKTINEIIFVQDSKQYVTLVKTQNGVLRPFYMRTGSGTRHWEEKGWAAAGQWVPYFGHIDLINKFNGKKINGWFIKPNTGRQGLAGDEVISKDLGEVMGINQQISGKEYGAFGVPKNNVTNVSTSADVNNWLRSKGFDPSTNSLTKEHLTNNKMLETADIVGIP
jgi:hypothetical protein